MPEKSIVLSGLSQAAGRTSQRPRQRNWTLLCVFLILAIAFAGGIAGLIYGVYSVATLLFGAL